MRIRPLFEPRDLWVGLYFDTRRRRVYVLPVPCFGLVIHY